MIRKNYIALPVTYLQAYLWRWKILLTDHCDDSVTNLKQYCYTLIVICLKYTIIKKRKMFIHVYMYIFTYNSIKSNKIFNQSSAYKSRSSQGDLMLRAVVVFNEPWTCSSDERTTFKDLLFTFLFQIKANPPCKKTFIIPVHFSTASRDRLNMNQKIFKCLHKIRVMRFWRCLCKLTTELLCV